MAQFAQLPAYYQETPLDYSPIQGITNQLNKVTENTFKQGHLDNETAKTDIARDTLGLHQSQFENQKKIQQIELMGRQALAVDQMPAGPARAAAHQRLLALHPEVSALDPQYHDPIAGPKLIASEAGAARDVLGDQLKRAQINLTNSHASFYRQAGAAKLGATGTEEDPVKNMGMDAEGNLVPLNARPRNALIPAVAGPNEGQPVIMQNYLGAKNDAAQAVGVREDHADYGPYGLNPSGVPGIVVTPKGVSDQAATRAAAGQKAIDESPEDARQRLIKHMDTQRKWTYLNGKAPSGYQWNEDGSLKDLKDASKKEIGRDKIAALLDDVATAKDVLTKSYMPTRALSHATGGWIAPEQDQAARSVEHAVQFLTAEVEGKRHANAQDVRMLRFFAPGPGDSAEMIGFKLDQLNRIMRGYFGQKVQSGDLFQSLLSKANAARQAREGTQPQPKQDGGPPQAAGGWVDVGGGVRIREKK